MELIWNKLIIYILYFSDGIITAQDFQNYRAEIKDPLKMQISDEYSILTPPPPSSGFIVGLTLQILGGKYSPHHPHLVASSLVSRCRYLEVSIHPTTPI